MRLLLILVCGFSAVGCIGDGVLNVQGYVVDSEGNGVPGASVVLREAGKVEAGISTAEMQTDAIGEFRFVRTCAPQAVRRGFELTVTKPGFTTVTAATTSSGREYIVLAKEASALD